jgi:hypothetical protein
VGSEIVERTLIVRSSGARRWDLVEAHSSLAGLLEDAVGRKRVEVRMNVERAPEELGRGHGARLGAGLAGAPPHEARDLLREDPVHRAEHLGPPWLGHLGRCTRRRCQAPCRSTLTIASVDATQVSFYLLRTDTKRPGAGGTVTSDGSYVPPRCP